MQWKTIDSAPKDGTKILVWNVPESDEYYSDEPGRLTPYGTHSEGGDFIDETGPVIAVWIDGWIEGDDHYLDGYWMPGWWFAWFDGDAEHAVAPTHWMPLPAPPKTKE